MLLIIATIILAFIVLLFLPDDEPSCSKHGTKYMYCHGYDENIDCGKCFEERHN